ncbi:hypothetical protein pb186bvf_007256 [Paramecium bursaria]
MKIQYKVFVIDYQNLKEGINQPIYTFTNEELQFERKKIKLNTLYLQYLQQEDIGQDISIISLFNANTRINIQAPKQQIQSLFEFIKLDIFQISIGQNYKLLKLVGQGAFAKVFKAVNLNTQQFFAIKQLSLEKNDKYQILKEIQILKQLNHESCIHLHEIYQEDNQIYLVLDYIQGGQLLIQLTRVKKVHYEQNIRDIVQTLLEGLEYLHSKNIIHRDIKPQNILRRSDKNTVDLVITDFGLAEFVQPGGNKVKNISGTPGFIAPELLRLEKYDQRIDMYSLGVTVYLIVTGQFPFNIVVKNNDLFEYVADDSRYIRILQNSQLSDLGIQFLIDCLQLDQNRRLTSKQALRHPWFKVKQIHSQFNLSSNSSCLLDAIKNANEGLQQSSVNLNEEDNFFCIEDWEQDTDHILHKQLSLYQFNAKFRT